VIGVATATNDVHALMIQRELVERGHECAVIEVDSLAGAGGLSWNSDGACVPIRGGGRIDVADLDLIWWRRTGLSQRVLIEDAAHADLVENDCRAALAGAMLTHFSGRWVNDPARAQIAENKLVQLKVARAAGMRVPDTLVSQDPARIRAFCATQQATVVKKVMGTKHAGLLTRLVSPSDLENEASLQITPAIYQEYVSGTRHLRVQCFGDDVSAVMITSPELDWRARLDCDFRPCPLPRGLAGRLRSVLQALGLRMGIVDLKLTDADEVVWLELNQQGQFLFLEGLTGVPLIEKFSDFLLREARESHITACLPQQDARPVASGVRRAPAGQTPAFHDGSR
jgi:glutathione synthase/RimK-type ligase-like ATP-grasp enzyme